MATRKPSQRDRTAGFFGGVTGADGYAIKALKAGTASGDQQRRAWQFILNRGCRIDEPEFVLDLDGGDRASAYAAGRRAVGLALKALASLPDKALRADKDVQSENPE